MSYILEINEQQMNLIEKALKLLQHKEELDRSLDDDDVEEIGIMIGMIPDTREEEKENPSSIHGWCL